MQQLLSAASTSLQTQIALKQDKSSMSSYATQSWVTSQNYLTLLPSTANFTSLTLYNDSVATTVYVDGCISSSAKQLLDAIGRSLIHTSVSEILSSLKVNDASVLTDFPTTASFTTLQIGTSAVATGTSVSASAKQQFDAKGLSHK